MGWRLLIPLLLLLVACSDGGGIETAERPTSEASLTIVKPADGSVLKTTRVSVVIDLDGGRVIDQTTTELKPDEGHIHVSLDGDLVSMVYGTRQKISVRPGQHLLQVEFVAGDHLSFEPSVVATSTFRVRG